MYTFAPGGIGIDASTRAASAAASARFRLGCGALALGEVTICCGFAAPGPDPLHPAEHSAKADIVSATQTLFTMSSTPTLWPGFPEDIASCDARRSEVRHSAASVHRLLGAIDRRH